MDKTQWLRTRCMGASAECVAHMPAEILARAALKTAANGAYAVQKGAPVRSVSICCSGKLEVKNELANGLVYSFATIEPVSYIGAMELLAESGVYAASVQAKTDCVFLELSAGDFLQWLYADSWLMLQVLRFAARSMFQQSWSSGESRAYPTVLLVARYLADRYAQAGQDVLFLRESKEDLSARFGVSVRTIHRALRQLREDGAADVTRTGIGIDARQHSKLLEMTQEMRENG